MCVSRACILSTMYRFYSDDANEDHTYRAAGFTIELRDTGRYGFQLPPDQVKINFNFNLCIRTIIDNPHGRGECGGCTCVCRRADEEPIEEVNILCIVLRNKETAP